MNPIKLQESLTDAIAHLDTPSDIPVVRKAYDNVKEVLRTYKSGVRKVLDDNSLLCIGVVGQMKAGKSSFLNSLLFDGDTVLPIAATPMTAGLTTLQYTTDKNILEICYYSKDDWEVIKNEANVYSELRSQLLEDNPLLKGKEKQIMTEMKKISTAAQQSSYELVENLTPEASVKIGQSPMRIEFEDINDLQSMMKDLVGARGKFTSVVSILHIFLKDKRLKGLRIVDTPGVNDPVVSREIRTLEFLHECHGVFMLSRAEHFFGDDDKRFMDERLSTVGISAILMIGSQFDTVLRNPQYVGRDLKSAVNDARKSLSGIFKSRCQMLRPETSSVFCACIFSSGMAKGVLIKLKKVSFDEQKADLDKDEAKFIEDLRGQYPSDFSDVTSTEKSLQLLADFESIEEVIINDFRKQKKTLILQKLTNYLKEQENVLNQVLNSACEKIKSELDFVNSTDLDQLKSQVTILSNATDSMVKPLKTTIESYAKKLEKRLIDIEQHDLQTVYVDCKKVKTSISSISYTRISTILSRKKNCSVCVDIINRESTKEEQEQAMEKYRITLDKKWRDMFIKFQEEMLQKMVEKTSQLESSLSNCTLTLANILDKTFNVELEGCETLKLADKHNEHIREMRNYVNDNIHTSFNNSFGKISESDADEKIHNQSKEKLDNIVKGLSSRDTAYMDDLKNIARNQKKEVISILNKFRGSIASSLEEGISSILEEKTSQLDNKQKTIDELQKGLERLTSIQIKYQ